MAYNAGKNSYTVLCQEKNSITRGLGKVKSLPKPNPPYRPPPLLLLLKSHMVNPL